MTPVLFYSPTSCAFGSIVTAEWLGLPYRLCRVEKADHENPDYLRLSPLGEVPALLLESGAVLTESVAILHHLGGRVPDADIVPRQGTPEFDRFNQVLAYLTTSFHPGFAPVFHADRFAAEPADQDKVRAFAIERLHLRYARVEEWLTDRAWLVTDQPSAADAYFYGIVRWGDAHFDVNGRYPRIGRFREALSTNPAVQFAQAIEDGRASPSSGRFAGEVGLSELSGTPVDLRRAS